MTAATNTFQDIKQRILDANDLELHFVALIVFNELATRRLGPDSLALDASGCHVTVAKKVVARAKTPKKKQDAVDAMFKLTIGEDLPPPETDSLVGFNDEDTVITGSVSPDPPSAPRPVPAKKAPVKKKD